MRGWTRTASFLLGRRARMTGIPIALTLTLTLAAPFARAQSQLDLPQPSWEHQCITQPARGKAAMLARQLEAEANQRGAEGWQLVHFVVVHQEMVICFARPQVVSNTTVTRLPEGGSRPELSGNWTELDADEAAAKVVADCLTNPTWISGKSKPLVRINHVINRTDEHLDAGAILGRMERALLESKKVRVLGRVGAADAKPTGAADYVMVVNISSVTDQVEGTRLKVYDVSAQLVDATTGVIGCVAHLEIKKVVTRPAQAW